MGGVRTRLIFYYFSLFSFATVYKTSNCLKIIKKKLFFHFSLGEEPTGVQSSLLWCLGGREIISVQAQIGEIIQGFTPIFMVFGPFFDGIW